MLMGILIIFHLFFDDLLYFLFIFAGIQSVNLAYFGGCLLCTIFLPNLHDGSPIVNLKTYTE